MENKYTKSDNDHVFAFLEILRILSKTENFQRWLSTHHKINEQQEFLEGYKYILTVSLRYFIAQLIPDDPFSLKDDEKLVRADFLGMAINNIPNSCEKTIVLKNIWKQSRKIREAKTFEEIKNQKPSELIQIYEILREQNLKPNKTISKEESISSVTQFNAYLFLIDTNFGIPRAAKLASIFEPDKSPEYLNTVFNGYRYALEYLWFCLLGPTKFQDSCVKDLHRSDKVCFENKTININNYEESDIEESDIEESDIEESDIEESDIEESDIEESDIEESDIEESDIEESDIEESDIEEHQKSKKEIILREELNKIHDKWRTIDQFFFKVRSEIIHPLEAKIGRIGVLDEGFLKLEGFDKKLFQNLITDEVEDAPYMTKTDEESMKERIDSELTWYPISVLNAGRIFSFNGAFSFVSMLRGLVDRTREEDKDSKITVKIFKHPAGRIKNGHNYSFGIKVEAYGAMSDGSGWLIFYDCATDYSGNGGHHHQMCMKEIKYHKEKNAIETEEHIFENEIFAKFLADKGIPMDHEQSRKIYEKMNKSLMKMRGKLLEYLVYKWILDKEEFETVLCDHIVNGEQIDCFCESNDKIEHFECKMQLHKIQETIKQIKRKQSKIKERYTKKINANLILYTTITKDKKDQLEKEGIRVHQDFKSNIENDRIFAGTRRELKSYLESDSNYYN